MIKVLSSWAGICSLHCTWYPRGRPSLSEPISYSSKSERIWVRDAITPNTSHGVPGSGRDSGVCRAQTSYLAGETRWELNQLGEGWEGSVLYLEFVWHPLFFPSFPTCNKLASQTVMAHVSETIRTEASQYAVIWVCEFCLHSIVTPSESTLAQWLIMEFSVEPMYNFLGPEGSGKNVSPWKIQSHVFNSYPHIEPEIGI